MNAFRRVLFRSGLNIEVVGHSRRSKERRKTNIMATTECRTSVGALGANCRNVEATLVLPFRLTRYFLENCHVDGEKAVLFLTG